MSATNANSPHRVVLAVNNQLSLEEAASVIGCHPTSIMNAHRDHKLTTGRKIGREWHWDAPEIYRAKETSLIVPRPRKKKAELTTDELAATRAKIANLKTSPPCNQIQIDLRIPREKADLIRCALAIQNKTLEEVLMEKVDALYEEICTKLGMVGKA